VKILDNLITRPLDDGLVVARPGGHRLFVMNASARFIWEQRSNGAEDAQIPGLIADHYGIDFQRAESDFRKTLGRWRHDGLIGPSGLRRRYAIGGIGFSVEYGSSDIEATIAPVIGHLQSPTPPSPQDGLEREFLIDCENGQFTIRADGIDVLTTASLDGIVEKLLFDIVMYAYARIDWLVSTHAAAIGTGHDCILLPGASGAGKSTLTASLLTRPQIRYLTDDMILLDRENLCAVPMPGALVLKTGSWDLLDPHLHGLASQTIHRRNNEDVKYWVPNSGQIAGSRLPVKAVVFPSRDSGSLKPVLTPLSPLEGLSRIITAPATINSPITSETVERLIAWAHRVPFYTLAYSRLEDASDPIEQLLGP
jgi:hypothetical protein